LKPEKMAQTRTVPPSPQLRAPLSTRNSTAIYPSIYPPRNKETGLSGTKWITGAIYIPFQAHNSLQISNKILFLNTLYFFKYFYYLNSLSIKLRQSF